MEKEIKNFKNLMLINKYPDRIPVIIEKNEKIILTNYKYLVPKKLLMSGFINLIRTNMNITEKQAIYLFEQISEICNMSFDTINTTY